jgi:drug/metabolite transporter, DME family
MPRDRTLLIGTLAALAAATLFGMLGPLSRFAAEDGVEGVAYTAWRAILGVSFLAILITARGALRPSVAAVRGLTGRARLSLAVAAVMGVTLNVSMFTAFGLIPIALALMLFYLYPAGVVVTDLVQGHERMTAPRLAALLLSSAGVVLVLLGGATDTGLAANPLGIVLGIAAAASQVVFITVSRHGYTDVPADAATLVILAASVVGASVIALLAGQGASLIEPFLSPEPWPVLLVSGIAAAGISSLLFLTAIRSIGGTRTGILMLLEPVVGVLLAALWLGEAFTPAQGFGGVLVLAGALVLQLQSDEEHEPIVEAAAGPVL